MLTSELADKSVSIPQRSDLNRTGRLCVGGAFEFQSRNGLIWTLKIIYKPLLSLNSFNPATVWFERCVPCQPILTRSRFNPATVWFEQVIEMLKLHPCTGFNPATVWFEQADFKPDIEPAGMFQSRNGLIWTEKQLIRDAAIKVFQSRNGLIWTITVYTTARLYAVFQSRNGLIWTITPPINLHQFRTFQSRNGLIWTLNKSPYNDHLDDCFNPATVWFELYNSHLREDYIHRFNPATVWFELVNASFIDTDTKSFNPATVWFELQRGGTERDHAYLFQSRNGLIWTRIRRSPIQSDF